MTGTIFDMKEMAVHDGPGIRTTVFFKGCPLRCRWCHNPEGLSAAPQLMYRSARCRSCGNCRKPCSHPECQGFHRCLRACPENCLSITGQQWSAPELGAELRKTAEVLGDSFGGFTFSGGEPLAQKDFLLALMNELRDYHLCIETSGYTDRETFRQVLEKLSFVIMDIKLADPILHKTYTGVSNEKILANLRILQASGKPYIIRTPLIPGITDQEENLSAIRLLIGNATWEQLPYNALAGAKYKMLDMEYTL